MSTPTEIFTSGNDTLATKLKNLVHNCVDKATLLLDESDNQAEILTAIKIAEVAGKMTGIVQEKQTINMQINNISGFTFIEVDKEAVIQEIRKEKELIEL